MHQKGLGIMEMYNFGNPYYHLSNIHAFLNSNKESWYQPSHTADEPQGYMRHYGFLRYFEKYELDAMLQQSFEVNGVSIRSLLRLPMKEDIIGDDRFNLFKRKGIRAHLAPDFLGLSGAKSKQYVPYLIADTYECVRSSLPYKMVGCINRKGLISGICPMTVCGIRPVCKITPSADVEKIGDGMYELVPHGSKTVDSITEEDLVAFLGLV